MAGLQREQWIIVGTEAHVCVLQTALGLHQAGQQVFVVADAVASRQPANCDLALQRLRQAGVTVVSREMVAYEWLYQAGGDDFRAINRAFLR
jgi:nicotinamidase-related amidase